MSIKAAKALIEVLKKEGVEVIFGIPGGAVIPIYDALYDEKDIRHILMRHEQGAAHAADGYARATGKVGVCMATSGPGATNLVTGIANAYMDSIPIVAITGQVRVAWIGRDSFQEADTVGITMPIVKHNYLVKDPKDLPDVVQEAFYIARTGRPGPVLIDIPVDVSNAEVEKFELKSEVKLRSYKPTYEGHPLMIRRAAELIEKSERPVMVIGGGVIHSGASKEVRELAERCNLPVAHTLMGKGGFPETHELSLGQIGMHGTVAANYAVTYSDLLLAVGMRFSDRSTGRVETFAPHARIIHIDIDPAEIGKCVKPTVPIVGDAKRVLSELLKIVRPKPKSSWHERIEEWKREFPLKYQGSDEVIKPQFVVEKIYELTGGEAIITTEVGQNQMWASQFYKCTRPRQFISSGGLGTMGFGLPAAIGAKVGRPDKMVIDIAGDGSVLMTCQQLSTAAKEKIPIKVMILNNSYLGMVRQWQQLFWDRRYSEVDLEGVVDFVKLAEAFGCVGLRATRPDEVEGVIEKALEINDKPVVVDFWVAREENVYPMVPAGGSIDKMLVD